MEPCVSPLILAGRESYRAKAKDAHADPRDKVLKFCVLQLMQPIMAPHRFL